uniref:ARAD1D18150p n=1 Tax=Blastobotrys adeninivorans TaxID=409370 RepID=A0A060TEY7_BLAAD
MSKIRTYHSKSRLGCVQCKSRHVKCDEAKPACGLCVRRGRTCEYRLVQSYGKDGAGKDSRKSRRQAKPSPISSSSSSSSPPQSASPSELADKSALMEKYSSLINMHTPGVSNCPPLSETEFYCLDYLLREGISRYTLGLGNLTGMWLTSGFQMALQSKTLFSSYLAFGGLMLGLRSKAMGLDSGPGLESLSEALSGLRTKLTQEMLKGGYNVAVAVLTAKLLTACSFIEQGIPVISFSGEADLLGLMQGDVSLLMLHREAIRDTFLNVFFEFEPTNYSPSLPQSSLQLEFLSYLWQIYGAVKDTLSGPEQRAYAQTLTNIQDMFDKSFRAARYTPIIACFGFLPNFFAASVRAKRPFALLVLLYLCSVVRIFLYSPFARFDTVSQRWADGMDVLYAELPESYKEAGIGAFDLYFGKVFVNDSQKFRWLQEYSVNTCLNEIDSLSQHRRRITHSTHSNAPPTPPTPQKDGDGNLLTFPTAQ